MGLESTKVQTYRVRYFCDRAFCDGEAKPTGMVLVRTPQQYIHKCNKCGHEYHLDTLYPSIRYDDVYEDNYDY